MKAIVYTEYGCPDVLKIEEIEKPFPKENEVLIKVHSVSVNFGDLIARNFKFSTFSKNCKALISWSFGIPASAYCHPCILFCKRTTTVKYIDTYFPI